MYTMTFLASLISNTSSGDRDQLNDFLCNCNAAYDLAETILHSLKHSVIIYLASHLTTMPASPFAIRPFLSSPSVLPSQITTIGPIDLLTLSDTQLQKRSLPINYFISFLFYPLISFLHYNNLALSV